MLGVAVGITGLGMLVGFRAGAGTGKARGGGAGGGADC